MRISIFKSKIHRATVTHADLDYEGSVTIDRDLLEAADIVPNEMVHIWNVTRGTRLVTYALEGPAGPRARFASTVPRRIKIGPGTWSFSPRSRR